MFAVTLRQARRVEIELRYPEPSDVWAGAPPSLKNIKYTMRVHRFRKKKKIFSWGAPRECFSRAPLWLWTGLLWKRHFWWQTAATGIRTLGRRSCFTFQAVYARRCLSRTVGLILPLYRGHHNIYD